MEGAHCALLDLGATGLRRWPYKHTVTTLLSQDPASASASAPIDDGPGLRRVFVIDSSQTEAELLQQRLRSHYPHLEEVSWTAEPASVLERVEAFAPDLVITEHQIPGYDLLGTIKALRKRFPHLPLLVMSAVAGEAAAVSALKAGANNFLPKSRCEELRSVIDHELAEARVLAASALLQAEAERQRRVNQAIFNQVHAGLWILSASAAVERANVHGQNMLGGFGRLGTEGFACIEAWWADSGEVVAEQEWPGARAVDRAEYVAPKLIRIRRFDGQQRVISCGATPLVGEDGASLGAVVMASDVSDEIVVQQRLRQAEERLRRLSLRQYARHEEQMAALSRELHDNLGQVLSLLKLHLMSAAGAAHNGQRRRLELDEALPLVDLALQRLREMCGELRPSELTDFGLVSALQSLGAAASRASGVPIEVVEIGVVRPLETTHQLGLFRVAQQALTNALRHAAPASVRLDLEWRDDAAVLSVSDDGKGFEVDAPRRSNQQGLNGMRERMELLGGQLDVHSQAGAGSTVSASLPLTTPAISVKPDAEPGPKVTAPTPGQVP